MAAGIHVLGAGALGCLVAGLAQRAQVRTTLLLRTEQSLQQFHQAGSAIEVQPSADDSSSSRAVRVGCAAEVAAGPAHSSSSSSSNAAREPPITHLIVTTKAQHTADALASVQHRVSSTSSVLLLQNGVLGVAQAVARLLQALPAEQRPALFAGIVTHGVIRQSPFSVVHAGVGSIVCGPLPDAGGCQQPSIQQPLQQQQQLPPSAQQQQQQQQPSAQQPRQQQQPPWAQQRQQQQLSSAQQQQQQQQQPSAQQQQQPSAQQPRQQQQQPPWAQQQQLSSLLSVLSAVPGLHVTHEPDPAEFHRQLLIKLAVNCCINPLTALYGCRNGALVSNPHLLPLVSELCSEVALTFGSRLRMNAQQLQQHVERVAGLTAMNRSSMLQDVSACRSTEVDFLNGYVVGQAVGQGLDAPVNRTLWTMVHAKETFTQTQQAA